MLKTTIWAASCQNQQNDCAPSEDSDQPWHPPSLIGVFACVQWVANLGPKLSSCGQRRLWADWADAQADLSLRWAHTHFVGVVMSRLNLTFLLVLKVTQLLYKSPERSPKFISVYQVFHISSFRFVLLTNCPIQVLFICCHSFFFCYSTCFITSTCPHILFTKYHSLIYFISPVLRFL